MGGADDVGKENEDGKLGWQRLAAFFVAESY
jgi:hypothetical protein